MKLLSSLSVQSSSLPYILKYLPKYTSSVSIPRYGLTASSLATKKFSILRYRYIIKACAAKKQFNPFPFLNLRPTTVHIRHKGKRTIQLLEKLNSLKRLQQLSWDSHKLQIDSREFGLVCELISKIYRLSSLKIVIPNSSQITVANLVYLGYKLNRFCIKELDLTFGLSLFTDNALIKFSPYLERFSRLELFKLAIRNSQGLEGLGIHRLEKTLKKLNNLRILGFNFDFSAVKDEYISDLLAVLDKKKLQNFSLSLMKCSNISSKINDQIGKLMNESKNLTHLNINLEQRQCTEMVFPLRVQLKSIRVRISNSQTRSKGVQDSDYIIKNLIIALDELQNLIELGLSLFFRNSIGREIFNWTGKFVAQRPNLSILEITYQWENQKLRGEEEIKTFFRALQGAQKIKKLMIDTNCRGFNDTVISHLSRALKNSAKNLENLYLSFEGYEISDAGYLELSESLGFLTSLQMLGILFDYPNLLSDIGIIGLASNLKKLKMLSWLKIWIPIFNLDVDGIKLTTKGYDALFRSLERIKELKHIDFNLYNNQGLKYQNLVNLCTSLKVQDRIETIKMELKEVKFLEETNNQENLKVKLKEIKSLEEFEIINDYAVIHFILV